MFFCRRLSLSSPQPPKGPTPWILRDFIPPVFSWIGNSIEFIKRPPSSHIERGNFDQHQRQHHQQDHHHASMREISYMSRVAMTQSVMESGHPWHIYAVENVYSVASKSKVEAKQHNGDNQDVLGTTYHYIASTRPKAGRPSRQIILDILSEWTES
jgi:hypothetical protein